MNKRSVFLTFFFSGVLIAGAQSQALPADPGVLTSAPEFSSWTVEFIYADKQQESSRQADYQAVLSRMAKEDPALAKALSKSGTGGLKPRMASFAVVKTKEIKHEISTFQSGYSVEAWSSPTARVSRNSKTEAMSYAAAAGPVEDFPEIKWVTAGNFREMRKVKGADCLVFRGKVGRAQIENPLLLEVTGTTPAPDMEVEVVVDATTRLPVSVATEEVTRSYLYTNPPAKMQSFPPEFKSLADAGESKVRARLAPLSAP